MERLQAAIEKAREQRESGTRRRSSGALFAGQGAQPADDGRREEIWQALPEISIRPRVARRNRLVALAGGAGAGPCDILRTRLLHQARSQGWRRIAIVSPDSGAGKSTVTANLALALGRQRDIRTMVLDYDLRRGGLARVLGQRPKRAMADLLEGKVAFEAHGVRHGTRAAFGLGRGGVRQPSEILQSRQALDTLSGIEESYRPDLVLVDLPPLMAADDNYGILSNMDAALIVVAAERTGLQRVDVAERQIAELTNVMGMVLNMARYTEGAYGYEYGYYYG